MNDLPVSADRDGEGVLRADRIALRPAAGPKRPARPSSEMTNMRSLTPTNCVLRGAGIMPPCSPFGELCSIETAEPEPPGTH